jgi:hypothetical protein
LSGVSRACSACACHVLGALARVSLFVLRILYPPVLSCLVFPFFSTAPLCFSKRCIGGEEKLTDLQASCPIRPSRARRHDERRGRGCRTPGIQTARVFVQSGERCRGCNRGGEVCEDVRSDDERDERFCIHATNRGFIWSKTVIAQRSERYHGDESLHCGVLAWRLV